MPRTKLLSPSYGLKLNKQGLWEVRWTEDGKTRTKSTGKRDKRAAEKVFPSVLAEITAPKRPDAPTVEEICKAYEKDRLPSVQGQETLKNALTKIIERLGSLTPDQLNDQAIRDYAKWRMNQRRLGNPKAPKIGPATVLRELNQLRPALSWAYRNGWIDREIKIASPVKSPSPKDRWLTKEEAMKLVKVGCRESPHLRLFSLIALATAARKTAILELKWDQIEWPEEAEPVEWNMGPDQEYEFPTLNGNLMINFGEGRGNKRRGRVPVGNNPTLYSALKTAKKKAKTDYVIEYRGSPLKDVKKGIALAYERAGLQGCSAHTLKHTSITWMVQAGLSFEQIAKLTSTSARTVEQTYGHHSPEFLQAIGDATSLG